MFELFGYLAFVDHVGNSMRAVPFLRFCEIVKARQKKQVILEEGGFFFSPILHV